MINFNVFIFWVLSKEASNTIFWVFAMTRPAIEIDLVSRVFANDPEDLGSIPDCVLPKTLKIVLDTSLLNTQQYKVRIKGKAEQYRGISSDLSYPSVL